MKTQSQRPGGPGGGGENFIAWGMDQKTGGDKGSTGKKRTQSRRLGRAFPERPGAVPVPEKAAGKVVGRL